jgi:hypothetical protein
VLTHLSKGITACERPPVTLKQRQILKALNKMAREARGLKRDEVRWKFRIPSIKQGEKQANVAVR